MSKDQIEYLKKEKRKNYFILSIQIFILLFTIFLWQYLSNNNIINSFIFSSPKNIFSTLVNLYNENNLLYHIWTTVKETLISFFLVNILSLFISIILYSNSYISKIFDPYLTVLNSLPKVALGPIIIIAFGANTKSIIIMSILISIIVSIQSIYIAFRNTDIIKIKLLKTFNASKKDILFKVVIPSNKNTIINTFKINISMCLVGVIMGEFLTSKAGIGYLILYGTQVFNLNLVYAGIFLLLIISILMYGIVSLFNKKDTN